MKKKSRSCEDESKYGIIKFMTLFLAFSIFFWLSLLLSSSYRPSFILEKENDDQLLPSGLDEKSCLSRHELPLYWRRPARKPSPHLISTLRSYEARHKRCRPHSDSYNRTLRHLENSKSSYNSTGMDCKYIVWISSNGLGNKMLTLASAFLYALLTDRVLLVDRGVDMPDLFCDPFPQASWFLPTDFPLTNRFNHDSNQSYGNVVASSSSPPKPYPYIYLHLRFNANEEDRLFLCDPDHSYLDGVPWLLLKSDQYFAPFFFLMPEFQQQLQTLFPEKDSVFHFLGRYLFHPSNKVWGYITRYYRAYLSNSDVITGIQVRTFDNKTSSFMEQILSCLRNEKILPRINLNEERTVNSVTSIRIVVLTTSLTSAYFDRVRDMYWKHGTAAGEVVGVFQPSHDEYQQMEKHDDHNRKALAEIYLLSLTDRLVTSGWSTFGYVARALGGVKQSWILHRPGNQTRAAEPPCRSAMSVEPCFMFPPPRRSCQMRRGGERGGVFRQCEDVSWGVKMV